MKWCKLHGGNWGSMFCKSLYLYICEGGKFDGNFGGWEVRCVTDVWQEIQKIRNKPLSSSLWAITSNLSNSNQRDSHNYH